MTTDLKSILQERNSNYGNYKEQCEISQFLKGYFRSHLTSTITVTNPDVVESLDCIAMKLSRIFNGNPLHIDSWRDIAGYATLIANRLEDDNE